MSNCEICGYASQGGKYCNDHCEVKDLRKKNKELESELDHHIDAMVVLENDKTLLRQRNQKLEAELALKDRTIDEIVEAAQIAIAAGWNLPEKLKQAIAKAKEGE